jgi:hypothetical protein
MQYEGGAENAFPGVSTAFADSSPALVLSHILPKERSRVFPLFNSTRSFATVKACGGAAVGDHADVDDEV